MNLAILSVGSDNGVQAGMEFTIYRGPEFVTKVVIEKADNEWSSCRSVLEFQKSRPQVDDCACSKPY